MNKNLSILAMLSIFISSTYWVHAATLNTQQKNGTIKATKMSPLTNKRANNHRGVKIKVPDLIVSRLEYIDREIRFRVKNIGSGTKKPGRLGYKLTVQTLTGNNQPLGTRSYSGTAALATLSRLRPGQETGDNRIIGKSLPLYMRITLCINRGLPRSRLLLESNYQNNCATKVTKQLLPDLAVLQGNLILFKPEKQKGLLGKIGQIWWDAIRGGISFDTSGVKNDAVVVQITNRGGVALTRFKIAIGVVPGGTYYSTYKETLRPGQIIRALVYLPTDKKRYGNQNCCRVVVALDPSDKIREVNESNNKKVLSVIREENIRDHRR